MKPVTAMLFLLGVSLSLSNAQYKPNWESIDSRPLPSWYDESKVGIFIHWGVFSVPSFGSEWFWWNWKGVHNKKYIDFMKKNYPPNFTYADFAPQLTTEFFDPDEWATIFKKSGARYIVLTSKHHEGFTLWPSKYSFNWNAMDVGPKRDLLGELATAVRAQDIRFGLYHSLFEWFHPLYLQDKANKFQTDVFVRNKVLPELHEVINAYEPDVIWSDGDWEASYDYWNSTEFLAWLYNESPVREKVVTNDRWGRGATCKHGGYLTCSDRFNPGVLQKRKWENCMTLDKLSWGYRRNAHLSEYLTIEDLLKTMAETVSCGGNLLVNVGPTKDGRIAPIFEERLSQMGEWLSVNGEAIYASKPWSVQNDTITSAVWYTEGASGDAIYATVLNWPIGGKLKLGSISPEESSATVSLLGYEGNLEWKTAESGIEVTFPSRSDVTSQWAWVLKFTTESEMAPQVVSVR